MRKPALKFLVFALVIPLSAISPAASAAIKVLPSKPAIVAVSPAGSGDQISDIALDSNSLAIVGTVENGLTDFVTSPTLGGSDGFISAFDKARNLLGFEASTSLDEMLDEVIPWIKQAISNGTI